MCASNRVRAYLYEALQAVDLALQGLADSIDSGGVQLFDERFVGSFPIRKAPDRSESTISRSTAWI